MKLVGKRGTNEKRKADLPGGIVTLALHLGKMETVRNPAA